MADQAISSVLEIIDGAHLHGLELTELQKSLDEAKGQITESAKKSKVQLHDHFKQLRKTIDEALDRRLQELQDDVLLVEMESLQPLQQCEEIIQQGIETAARVKDEGKKLLADDPENNVEMLLRYKENPDSRTLNRLPEVPCLADVAYISADFPASHLEKHLVEAIEKEGNVIGRAPVRITDIEELPGSLLVKWSEVDEDSPVDVSEFCLQYSYGNIKSNDDPKATFHTAYSGPDTLHTIKYLRTHTPYSFRVSCKGEGEKAFGVWTVPRVATTTISHYQWCSTTEGYCTSNEHRGATRTNNTPDRNVVIYSNEYSYQCGYPITFKVLDVSDRGPEDGVGIALAASDNTTLKREEALFVSIEGAVFVNGQEMKNKLPMLTRGVAVSVDTELLSNGRIRVSAAVKDKEVTFDWKIVSDDKQTVGCMATGDRQESRPMYLYFAMSSTKEDWKISVE